ncbi:hypothetical protein [Actinobaculum sp. 352]|uniref:hypothetical protein n=1 Tax=Actinobaculum sp. 352 TaxID=2490946 RepID=UPI000F7DF91D|nr:hypothetical protein [Actinobaculum sp. 352]
MTPEDPAGPSVGSYVTTEVDWQISNPQPRDSFQLSLPNGFLWQAAPFFDLATDDGEVVASCYTADAMLYCHLVEGVQAYESITATVQARALILRSAVGESQFTGTATGVPYSVELSSPVAYEPAPRRTEKVGWLERITGDDYNLFRANWNIDMTGSTEYVVSDSGVLFLGAIRCTSADAWGVADYYPAPTDQSENSVSFAAESPDHVCRVYVQTTGGPTQTNTATINGVPYETTLVFDPTGSGTVRTVVASNPEPTSAPSSQQPSSDPVTSAAAPSSSATTAATQTTTAKAARTTTLARTGFNPIPLLVATATVLCGTLLVATARRKASTE